MGSVQVAKARCPACGEWVTARLGQWCEECGNTLFVGSVEEAERQRAAAEELLGGDWFAAPTPIVGVYAVGCYSDCVG